MHRAATVIITPRGIWSLSFTDQPASYFAEDSSQATEGRDLVMAENVDYNEHRWTP